VDKIKLGLAVLVGLAGVVGFYLLQESPTVVRIMSLLFGFAMAIAIAMFTAQGKHFFAYSRDSIEETKKVVWPSRKETLQTAGVVFAFVMAMAVFLWLVDAGLMTIVRLVMDQEG
jgi:preprotein translocase subunit SecE